MTPDLHAAFSTLDFNTIKTLAIAVSGGSDSVATLLALDAFLKDRNSPVRLIAFTVDHGLRSGSADEAAVVADLCASHGIGHETLIWTDLKPTHGVQRLAREARYRLLANAAVKRGADAVVTGHTRNDNLETALMRSSRGEGRGLAGIAPATLYDNRVWFLRPMLFTDRADLQTWLSQRGVTWMSDPSNEDDQFERVRVRAKLAAESYEEIETAMFVAREQRSNLATGASESVLDTGLVTEISEDGSRAIVAPALADQTAGDIALASLLAMIGQKEHLPSGGALKKAVTFVRTGANGTAFTVHGCTLKKANGDAQILREPRNCGARRFGFDRLLPCFDLPLAEALRRRRGLPQLPPLPLAGERC